MSKYGDFGALGVRIFFTISGFLITSLLLDELNHSGGISIKKFFLRRALRIFPAYYGYLVIISLCTAIGWISLRPGDLVASLTYTINYHYDRSWWVGHAWSLSVEEQFYLLFPLLLAFLGRKAATLGAVSVVVLAPIVRVILLSTPGGRSAAGEAFPAVADTIAMGCLLALVEPWLARQPKYLDVLRSRYFALVPLTVVVLNMNPGGRIRAGLLETIIAFLIVLMIDRWVRFPDGPSGRLLNSRPFVKVGILSYSIYLWQQPFLTRSVSGPLQRFPVNLICLAVTAWLSYKFIEQPFLTIRKRLEQRQAARGGGDEPRFLTVCCPSEGSRAYGGAK
jgi:peptidoglycan/LPS O-acetylase OafA/YrhL